jgi:hypothetical protein
LRCAWAGPPVARWPDVTAGWDVVGCDGRRRGGWG